VNPCKEYTIPAWKAQEGERRDGALLPKCKIRLSIRRWRKTGGRGGATRPYSGADPQTGHPAIHSPSSGEAFVTGEVIFASGVAYDPEEGYRSGASLQWSIDGIGPVGEGETVHLPALGAGEHVLRLTATDGDGRGEASQVSLSVSGCFLLHVSLGSRSWLLAMPRPYLSSTRNPNSHQAFRSSQGGDTRCARALMGHSWSVSKRKHASFNASVILGTLLAL
jgi:hypothetical protein